MSSGESSPNTAHSNPEFRVEAAGVEQNSNDAAPRPDKDKQAEQFNNEFEGDAISSESENDAFDGNGKGEEWAVAPVVSVPAPVRAEEVDESSVAREISDYMQVNRVNIGELETLEDMWGLCDAISAAHSGLPDSLLKGAFLIVLEGLYAGSAKSWSRKHLDHLLRMWKKEMLNEKSRSRQTKFVSSSASYTPPHGTGSEQGKPAETGHEPMAVDEQQQQLDESKPEADDVKEPAKTAEREEAEKRAELAKLRRQRKQAAKRKRALVQIMGVGQLLEHARRKFATEDGELDVDEDEQGNFTIGGMELSFETWGQINKIKEDGIVQAEGVVQRKRWKGSQRPQKNGKMASNQAPKPPNLSTGSQSSMAEQYPTVGEVEMPGEPAKGKKKGRKQQLAAAPSPKPTPEEERDEGEISSSNGERPTSSSSSEDDDSEEEEAQAGKRKRKMVKKRAATTTQAVAAAAVPERAQDRRKAKREDQRQQGASNAQNLQALLRKCFELRGRIVRKLSIQQKAMLMDMMKQSMAGNLQQQQAMLQQQHQAMAQLVNAFQQRRQP